MLKKILLFTFLLLAGILGMTIIVWATEFRTFSLLKVAVYFSPLLIFMFVLTTRQDMLAFLVKATLVLYPMLGFIMPPWGLEISLFDYIGVLLASIFILEKLRGTTNVALFPVNFVWILLLCMLPSVFLSIDAARSAFELLRCLLFYILFICLYHYAATPGWSEWIGKTIGISAIIISLGVIVHKVFGVSFSLLYDERGLVSETGGYLIKQGTGFFQDPQKAGQAIAVFAVYLTVHLTCGTISNKTIKLISVTAITLAIPALLLTVSKLAIVSGISAMMLSYLLLNRHDASMRAIIVAATMVVGLVIVGAGATIFMKNLLPQDVIHRFSGTDEAAEGRYKIWRDSWKIYMEYPIAGVGLGNYREYLLRDEPKLRRYFEAGYYVPEQPESGYLKILYEAGSFALLGMIYFILAFYYTTFINIRLSATRALQANGYAAIACMSVVIITFITLFTIVDPRNAILPILSIAITNGVNKKRVPYALAIRNAQAI